MNAAQRKLRAQMGAHALWAKAPDRAAVNAPGREAAEARFEKQIRQQFPDMPDDEVIKRAASLRSAFYAEIQLKSARARSARAAGAKTPKK